MAAHHHECRTPDASQLRTAVVSGKLVTENEIADVDPIPNGRVHDVALPHQLLVVEVQRTNRLERPAKALVVAERAVPQGPIGRPLLGRGRSARIRFGLTHELVARGRPDDDELLHSLGIAGGVHEAEVAAPADAEQENLTEA